MVFAYLISFLGRVRITGTKLARNFKNSVLSSVSVLSSSGGASGAAGLCGSVQGAKQGVFYLSQ